MMLRPPATDNAAKNALSSSTLKRCSCLTAALSSAFLTGVLLFSARYLLVPYKGNMNHLFAKALAFRDALWLIGELPPLHIAGIITITLFTAWLGAITLAVDGNLLGLIAAVYDCVVNEKVFLGEGASWQNPLRLADLILWRLPTSWWRRVPDIFVLGAQKAGTTSLHHYLVGTSDEAYDGDDLTRTYPFGGAMVKETHFLDGRSPYGTMGEASDSLRRRLLASFFPLSFAPTRRLVEATPEMLYCSWMIPQLHRCNPNAQFIVLLRSPVARAISSFSHQTRKNRERRSFGAAINEELDTDAAMLAPLKAECIANASMAPITSNPEASHAFFRTSYVERGRYAEQVDALLAAVPREQCLFINSTTLFEQTRATVTMVYDWLGAPPPPESLSLDAKNTSGIGPKPTVLPKTLRLLSSHLGGGWECVRAQCTYPDNFPSAGSDRPMAIAPLAKGDESSASICTLRPTRSAPIIYSSMPGAYIGRSVSGPSVIPAPAWIEPHHRLGRYYCYFAQHTGKIIRIAVADTPTGPWRTTGTAIIHVADSDGFDHVASPDVQFDPVHERIVMYFHSPTQTKMPFRSQMTFCATSADGVHFSAMRWRPKIPALPPLSVMDAPLPKQYLGRFYFKTFTLRGQIYALARNNRHGAILYRKPGSAIHGDPVGPWLRRPGGTAVRALPRMRHAAVNVSRDETTLHIFYSRVGDAPEGIYVVDFNVANKDWKEWKQAGKPRLVMLPQYRWEGGHAFPSPTTYGARSPTCVSRPAADIRDPCLLKMESGQVWLFYAGGGEGGIGVTEIKMPSCGRSALGVPELLKSAGRLAGKPAFAALPSPAKLAARKGKRGKGKRGKAAAKAARSIAGSARRVVLYDAGCIGLGHTRRCARLARALVQRSSAMHPTDVLIITGTDVINSFLGNQSGIDYVHLPGYKRDRTLPAAGPWHQYRSRSLLNPTPSCANSGIGLQSMRAQLIKAALLSFRPDTIIVDFEPVGVFSELAIGITATRAVNPNVKVILGVRDVLDDPDQIRAEWNAKAVFPFLQECYDGVLVYGIESIHNPLRSLLPASTSLDVHFVGYLGGGDDDDALTGCSAVDQRSAAFAKFTAKHVESGVFTIGEFVIVSGGGGSDAGELYDWVLRACEDHGGDGSAMLRFIFVFGPYCPEHLTLEFSERIAMLRSRGLRIIAFNFVDPLIMEALLANAGGIVAMCGANTFTEILKFNLRAIVVPRESFRQEQLIRAQAFAARGMVTMLRMTSAVGQVAPSHCMASALHALPNQARPSASIDLSVALNGLAQTCHVLAPSSTIIRDTLSIVHDESHTLVRRLEVLRDLRELGTAGYEALHDLLVSPPSDFAGRRLRLFHHECLYMLVRASRVLPAIPDGLTLSLTTFRQQYRSPESLEEGIAIRWPAFLVLGASKCGTSSVVRYLLRQPDVIFQSRSGGVEKPVEDTCTDMGVWDDLEVHTFDVEPFAEELMLSRHASFNPPATPENADKMLGSYTPHYIFHPFVPFNLAAMMPLAARNSMKFVIFLRDPVERAISSFWFKKRTKAETAVAAAALRQGMARRRKMEKAVRLALGVSTSRTDVRCIAEASRVSGVTPPSAQRWKLLLHSLYFERTELSHRNLFCEHIGKGCYWEQLLRWWSLFPKENFFITSLEEFQGTDGGYAVFTELLRFLRSGRPAGAPAVDEGALRELLRKRYNTTPAKKAVSEELRAELNEFYRPYNARLFKLVGRRLW